MASDIKLTDVTVAYVLIKAELGAAHEVASQVSALEAVRWASVVTGPYDVIAGVRVPDNEILGDVVVREIQTIPGVRNPLTSVMSSTYEEGELQAFGKNGPP